MSPLFIHIGNLFKEIGSLEFLLFVNHSKSDQANQKWIDIRN